jgi:primase-polymerase (primpol)-like protein
LRTVRYYQDQTLRFPKPGADALPRSLPAAPLDDQELVEKMLSASNGHNVEALWRGDLSAHDGDHSAADLALCNHLAWWTSSDAAQIDRVFRGSALI